MRILDKLLKVETMCNTFPSIPTNNDKGKDQFKIIPVTNNPDNHIGINLIRHITSVKILSLCNTKCSLFKKNPLPNPSTTLMKNPAEISTANPSSIQIYPTNNTFSVPKTFTNNITGIIADNKGEHQVKIKGKDKMKDKMKGKDKGKDRDKE